MLLGLIKLAAPMILSSLIGVDDWLSPIKQENPYTSIVGATMKNLGEYLLNESTNNEIGITTETTTNDDNPIKDLFSQYENKSYRMNFK